MKKRLISVLLSIAMLPTLILPVFATEAQLTDADVKTVVTVEEGNVLANIARNKAVEKSDGTALVGWTDGDVTNYISSNGVLDCYVEPAEGEEETKEPIYGIISLEGDYDIEAISVMSQAAGVWCLYTTEFYGTDNLQAGLEGATLLGTLTSDLVGASANNPAFIVENDDTFKYILVKKYPLNGTNHNFQNFSEIRVWAQVTEEEAATIPNDIVPATTKDDDSYVTVDALENLIIPADGNDIANFAKGRSFVKNDGTSLAAWVDGNHTTKANTSITKYSTSGNYGILDLGMATAVDAIGIDAIGCSWWNAEKVEFYGTNNKELGFDAATFIGEITTEHVRANTDGDPITANPAFIVNDTNAYQYILVRTEGASLVNIFDIMVYKEVAEDAVANEPVAAQVQKENGDYITLADVNDLVTLEDGKGLANIARDKAFTMADGTLAKDWVDGIEDINATGKVANGSYAVLDLGEPTKIEAISVLVNSIATWNVQPVSFYGANDLEYGTWSETLLGSITSAHASALAENNSVKKDLAIVVKDTNEYRYVVIRTGCDFTNVADLAVYAQVAEEDIPNAPVAAQTKKDDNTYVTAEDIENLVTVEDGKRLVNIAEDKTITKKDGVQLPDWTDGDAVNKPSGGICSVTQYKTTGDYVVIDLGASVKVDAIEIAATCSWWNVQDTAFYGTNNLDNGFVGATLLGVMTADHVKANIASNALTKNPAFIVNDTNSYRYIIVKSEAAPFTNIAELLVYAQVTPVSAINVTNPEAVTNVGENAAYLTVDYSGNVVVNENTTVVAKNKADIGKDTVLSADKTFNLKAVAVDEDTILVDPVGIISNATYDVTISGVATAEGDTAASVTVEMTTGEVANIAYDGGIIENVAANKSAIAYFTKDDAAKTADFGAWVDGNTVADIQLTKAEHAKGYVVIDLGLPYKIGSIGASTKACWNATGARFALTNTIPTSYEEAIALNAAQLRWADYDNTSTGRVGNVFDFVKAVDSETKYQYVVIWDASENSGWSCQLAEVFVYTKKGSEDESDIVTTVDFKGMQNAVTNVDTKDLVTVNFNADVDMATVNNDTVYAVVAEEKKDDSPDQVVIAQGARYEVGIIKTDGVNNSFGIDVSKLPSNVKYTLVVKDVMDLDDKYVVYTSDVFTTGIVANVAYDKDALIKNVAYGKDIYPGVATDKTHSLDTWVNGVADSDPFNLLGGTFPENFVVIDLGADYNVQSMGVQITQTAWNAAGMGIFTFPDGTDMSTVTFASLTTPASRLSFTSDGAAVFDNMVDVVNVSGNARYIVLKDMTYTNGGNLDLKVKEIYVFVKEMESDATVTVDFKGMKDAVTNVGTDELITVTFDKDIKETSLDGTVYAVSQTERKYESFNDKGEVTEFISGVAIGDIYPLDVIYVDSKTIKLDPQNLEAFCDFKLVIDGVRDADDEYIKYTSDVFTTGLIAKVAYSEGKIIKNVALGKSMTIINPLDPEIHGGNGIVEAGEAEMIANAAEKLIDGDYVNSGHTLDIRPAHKNHDYFVLDLGKKYQIESIGVMWSSSRWGSAGTSVYLTNDISAIAPANGAELVKSKDAKGCTGVFDYADVKAKFDNADGYRYVILYNDSGRNDATSISPLEVSVFAYETENDFYFAKEVVTKIAEVEVNGEMKEETVFDKVLVKATIENAEAGTVVVAEYNASGKLLNVKTATVDNGVATADLTYTAGNTYKAFIWNALSGENALTPTLPAITYDIQ